MNKTLLTFALILATPAALATAPNASYVQVQDTSTSTDTNNGVAEQAGQAVDQAAQSVGNAVDNAVTTPAETTAPVDTTTTDTTAPLDTTTTDTTAPVDTTTTDTTTPDVQNNAVTTPAESDGIPGNEVDNTVVANNRGFPWGLLGLIGLFGLAGRNKPVPVVHPGTGPVGTTDRR